MYSCRYGNIYTTRQLLQLFDRAFGHFKPTLDWWLRPDGRYVDPFRPRIEPDGYATIEDMRRDRETHLAAVRNMFETMDVFLFTFGLTESWVHREDGAVLQLAPGVAGGEFDESKYKFWNARASEVASDYLTFVDKLKAINPNVRLIVSVSPVPIIATYMPRHALVSNSASKSTLRVACDEVVAARPEIAYFPSYDLVSFGPNAARYYKDSLRELNSVGLSAVMRAFFDHFTAKEARGNEVRALRIDVSRETAETADRRLRRGSDRSRVIPELRGPKPSEFDSEIHGLMLRDAGLPPRSVTRFRRRRTMRDRRRVVEPVFLHLAIERRAADAEAARHFRHLSAIIVEREADRLGFEIVELAHLAMIVEQLAHVGVAHLDAHDFALHARSRAVGAGRGGTRTSNPSTCAAICGNSATVSSSPSASTTARNTAFSSWRTLPGQS